MVEGIGVLLGGMRDLLLKRELRAVLWRMLGLLLVLMLLLIGGVFGLTDYLAHLWLPEGDAWYWQLLGYLVWIIAALLALLTGIVTFSAVGSAAVAPWLDSLAARAEALHGKGAPESSKPWYALVLESLGNSVRPLFGLLVMGAVALALLLIPVLGPLLATAVWGYAGIRFLNYELMDTVASRRDWAFAERKGALQSRRFFWLGFGGLAMALMLVPLVNLLVLPAAVVGLSRSLSS